MGKGKLVFGIQQWESVLGLLLQICFCPARLLLPCQLSPASGTAAAAGPPGCLLSCSWYPCRGSEPTAAAALLRQMPSTCRVLPSSHQQQLNVNTRSLSVLSTHARSPLTLLLLLMGMPGERFVPDPAGDHL